MSGLEMEMLPRQVIAAALIESALVVTTVLFLVQPKLLFWSDSVRVRALATFGGWMLLSVTFCWSFVFGVVLTLNGVTFR